MSEIRSALLFIGQAANNVAVTAYTAPAGHTAIVKSINGINSNAQAAVLIVRVATPQVPLRDILRVNAAAATSFTLLPWLVLPAGAWLIVQAGGTQGYNLAISGAVLLGVVDL